MRCAICYQLYNLKNVKNIHGGALILVKSATSACNVAKINTPPWVFSRFLNCTNIPNRATHHISSLFISPEGCLLPLIKQNC